MTVDLEYVPTSQDALPTVLFDNILTRGTYIGTGASGNAGLNPTNALDEGTTKVWDINVLSGSLAVDLGGPVSANAFGVVAHDLFTKGCLVTLQTSTTGTGSWVSRTVTYPKDNGTLLTLFNSVSSRYWRVVVNRRVFWQQTEDFSDATWAKLGLTVATNSFESPILTPTADKLVENSSTSEHYIEQGITVASGSNYTMSVYVKSDGTSDRRIVLRTLDSGGNNIIRMDLATGIITTATNTSITASGKDTLSNGWYRFWMRFNAVSSGNARLLIQMSNAAGTLSYLGDGTSGVVLWGAQFEQSLDAGPGPYVPVTTFTAMGTPKIGVIMLGNKLVFPAGVLPPYKPVWLSQTYELMTSTTLGGQFIGNKVKRQGGETQISLASFSRSFGENDIQDFRESYNLGKAFIFAAGPSVFPNDVGYCWRKENSIMSPVFDENGSWMSASMEVYTYGQ